MSLHLSHTQSCLTLATPWTVARQAPLSMGFSRQYYWSGLPCLPPGDLPDPGTKPASLMSPALGGRFFTTSATWEAPTRSPALQADSSWNEPPGKTPYDLSVGAQLLQSCLTLCNLMDCSLPGSSVSGILQARILEWIAMPFSRGSY